MFNLIFVLLIFTAISLLSGVGSITRELKIKEWIFRNIKHPLLKKILIHLSTLFSILFLPKRFRSQLTDKEKERLLSELNSISGSGQKEDILLMNSKAMMQRYFSLYKVAKKKEEKERYSYLIQSNLTQYCRRKWWLHHFPKPLNATDKQRKRIPKRKRKSQRTKKNILQPMYIRQKKYRNARKKNR